MAVARSQWDPTPPAIRHWGEKQALAHAVPLDELAGGRQEQDEQDDGYTDSLSEAKTPDDAMLGEQGLLSRVERVPVGPPADRRDDLEQVVLSRPSSSRASPGVSWSGESSRLCLNTVESADNSP